MTYHRAWFVTRLTRQSYIEEEQTTQWPKEKVLKDKQRSTKYTCKTKDRVTRTPLKIEGESDYPFGIFKLFLIVVFFVKSIIFFD
jgi:hypothetical protein